MSEQCAVWYKRYHSTYFELADDERGAASFAYNLEVYGEGSVLGVQFADGRLVKAGDWEALANEEAERMREIREAPAPPPPKPTRTILSPFDSDTTEADYNDPPWLGAGVSRG